MPPSENPMPADPMTELGTAAAGMHEIYLGYIEAGFTPQQSLYLVGQMLREMVAMNASNPDA